MIYVQVASQYEPADPSQDGEDTSQTNLTKASGSADAEDVAAGNPPVPERQQDDAAAGATDAHEETQESDEEWGNADSAVYATWVVATAPTMSEDEVGSTLAGVKAMTAAGSLTPQDAAAVLAALSTRLDAVRAEQRLANRSALLAKSRAARGSRRRP